MRLSVTLSLAWVCATLALPAYCSPPRPFTVADGINLANFFPYYGTPPVIASPSGRFVAIRTERGLLDKDRMEDELRVYDRAVLRGGVRYARKVNKSALVLDLHESTYRQGPLMTQIRWLRDSSGLVLLLRDRQGLNELTVVSLKHSAPRALSLKGQNVTAFDVRDPTHYAYTVFRPGAALRRSWIYGRAEWDATGHSIWEILLPREWEKRLAHLPGPPATGPLRSVVWMATGGKPREMLQQNGGPVVVYPTVGSLALSPNGSTLATEIPLPRVPGSWARKFRPAPDQSILRIQAGDQNLSSPAGTSLVSEYVLINARTGAVTTVNAAPTGSAGGWFSEGNLAWSDDGKALLLPNAYPQPTEMTLATQPCIAVFYLATGTMQCLEAVKPVLRHTATLTSAITETRWVRFANHSSDKVITGYVRIYENRSEEAIKVLVRGPSGAWSVSESKDVLQSDEKWPEVYIKQGLNEPPVVVTKDSHTQRLRVLWDPNPHIKDIALGDVSVYQWTDKLGHEWSGGLYKPTDFVAGRRYPLVVQTHGFPKERFSSSGIYPTAMAARPLASAGIVVLQTSPCFDIDTPQAGPCDVASIEAAVRKLADQGIIDASRVGIVGFSYTVYSVLEALTTSSLRFAAASMTDGWSYGYWEYMTHIDAGQDAYARAADATVGAKPFGAGLQLWLKRAPGFNMQKIHTPLLVNSLGRISLLDGMWELYAPLRYLHRPVDLVIIDSDEHLLTNPAARMASQSGSVDWFRFWLQGREDTDPAKAMQFRRWEKMCDMQKTEAPSWPTYCVTTRRFGTAKSTDAMTVAARTVPPP